MVSIERIREISIEQFLSKYESEPSHSRQVTKLAMQIFDNTRHVLHNYELKERNYLKYASLLHDSGYYIAPEKHNKHTYTLITQSKMDGFTPYDLEIIANIARYHRGALPNKKHSNYEALNKTDKIMIKSMSAILRIADGLDRSHTDVINAIKILVDTEQIKCTFFIESKSINCASELFAAKKKADLFEKTFAINCEFKPCQSIS